MWCGDGEQDFYFYHNFEGHVVFSRPFDFGKAIKKKTNRRRKGAPTKKEEEKEDVEEKPRALLEIESAWAIQRVARQYIARRRIRLKRADKLVSSGRKTTQGWIAFDDPTSLLVFGAYYKCYVNVETHTVLWRRTYENAAERYAREKREAIELQLNLDTEMIHYGRLGNVHEARRRVRKGANMYYLDPEHGCTLAHFAAARSLMNVLQWLNAESFNFSFKDRLSATPLHYAAKSGNERVIEFLLQRSNVHLEGKDNRGRTPLLWAAFGAQTFAIEMLRDAGADLHSMDNAGCTAVHRASNSPISGKRMNTISWLQAEGLNLRHKDNWGWTPVNKAYTCKQYDVVEELKRHGCDLTVENNFESIEGWTPVHVAALQGRVDALEYLHKRGCELDVPDKRDETPLHLAAGNGHEDAVKYLLRQGCSTKTRNNIGQTPKDVAARLDHENVIEIIQVTEDRMMRLEQKKEREKQKAKERLARSKKKK